MKTQQLIVSRVFVPYFLLGRAGSHKHILLYIQGEAHLQRIHLQTGNA